MQKRIGQNTQIAPFGGRHGQGKVQSRLTANHLNRLITRRGWNEEIGTGRIRKCAKCEREFEVTNRRRSDMQKMLGDEHEGALHSASRCIGRGVL